jgi:hypothetical protein
LKFLFDNQLSPYLADAIHALAGPDGDQVIHLRKKFPPNTSDKDWILSLSAEGGWIVVCGDLDIIRTKAEKPIWKSAGLIGFFLKKGWINIGPWDQAWRLVKWWPTIVAAARIAAPGATFGVQVNPTGKLETL